MTPAACSVSDFLVLRNEPADKFVSGEQAPPAEAMAGLRCSILATRRLMVLLLPPLPLPAAPSESSFLRYNCKFASAPAANC